MLTLPAVPTRAAVATTRQSVVVSSEHRPTAAGRGPERRAATVEDGRDASPRAGTAGHRQDATLVPEEFLRTLVEAEITARDESNARTRMRTAAFPVAKRLEEFDVTASSIPQGDLRLPRQPGMDPRRKENCCLIGPAGTGKSHMLVALGVAAVEAGHRVRYFTAAELVETLYRALADNSVGRVIETLLRNDLVLVDELGLRAAG